MSIRKLGRSGRAQAQVEPALGRLLFYMVLTLATIEAMSAYSAGATLEIAAARGMAIILGCTMVGYGINLALLLGRQAPNPLNSRSAHPSPPGQMPTGGSPHGPVPASAGALVPTGQPPHPLAAG